MTDWGAEPPYTEDQLKALNIEADLTDWFWVLHPNAAFNGPVGILHFTNGKAAYAPEYIYDRGKAQWFQDDGEGGIELNPNEPKPPLWVLLWCWFTNSFVITPMNGGQAEYDELIPTESVLVDGEWIVPESLTGGGGESMTMETGAGAGEEIDGEEEVTNDG